MLPRLKKLMELTPEYVKENEDVILRSTAYIKQGHDKDRYDNLVDFARPFKRVLSVGCSGFEPVLYGATHALDVSPVAGQLLRSSGYEGEFKVGSCTSIPWPDRTFDCAVCSEVIEHLPADDDVLKTFVELDRVASSWLVTTPAAAVDEHTHKRLLDDVCVQRLANQFGAKYERINIWWFIWKSPVFWRPMLIPRDAPVVARRPGGRRHGK